ncbi:DUF58 domain-containing protein [Natrialbaceae archaeon A-gly3]
MPASRQRRGFIHSKNRYSPDVYPTRQLWAGVVLVATLIAFAVILERPLLFAGATVLGAWILAQQIAFIYELDRVRRTLTVEQDVDPKEARTGGTTVATLSAWIGQPTQLDLVIEGGLPTAARTDGSLSLSVGADITDASDAVSVTWPIAGHHRFDRATVSAANSLFEETIAVGNTPRVTVEPPQPRHVHIGAGGTQVAAVHGAHSGGQAGSGIEPLSLREYVSGDTADQIDWKTTARLGTTYVREYEAETNQQTLLVVDERPSLSAGPSSETKLDYLREVALSLAANARKQNDSVGLLTINDDGGSYLSPASAGGGYEPVRKRLLDLEATQTGHATDSGSPSSPLNVGNTYLPTLTGSDVRKRRVDLEGGSDDSFSKKLLPFYATRGETDRQLGQTLPAAVRSELTQSQQRFLLVVCTDDTQPAELHELTKIASRQGHEMILLLAPSILYVPGGLTDLDQAYNQYLEFEELRRELSRQPNVTAFEVGPGDRLASVLPSSRLGGGSREN